MRLHSLLIFCFAFLCGAFIAQAHPLLRDAMQVEFKPQLVRVTVDVSLKEICVAQGVDFRDNGIVDADALNHEAGTHGDYLLKHLTLSANGIPLSGKIVKLTPPPLFNEPEETFYRYELEYPVAGPLPTQIVFYHDMLKEWPYAAGIAWDVSYVVRIKRSSGITSWLLPCRQQTTFPTGWEAPVATATVAAHADDWRTFREYFRHGVMHILTGYDHLLFVSALVMATMSFWELVKVVAAFTLAHTLTLTLSVFNIVRLPSYFVEPVIALSIVFVALENILWPQRAHSRLRLAVAFGFGLVHGLGFAGGLLDAMEGLPSIGIWIALAAFSLGVEIGHQIVVLPLFGILTLSRHKVRGKVQASILRFGSVIISCCGAYYFVVALQEQLFSR
jgi:hydrogenase/urease accessory protein HupE